MRCARAKNRSSEDKESYLRPQNLLSCLETKTRMAREEVVEKIMVFLSTPPQNSIFSGKKSEFLVHFPVHHSFCHSSLLPQKFRRRPRTSLLQSYKCGGCSSAKPVNQNKKLKKRTKTSMAPFIAPYERHMGEFSTSFPQLGLGFAAFPGGHKSW